ncbi:hypothetical protein ACOXRD_004629 [Escherichia coli O9,9a:H30]
MSKYEELEEKGMALVEMRNESSGSQRELLNREISSIRQAQLQLKALAEEVTAALKLAIPAMVEQAINESDVVKAIEDLRRGE